MFKTCYVYFMNIVQGGATMFGTLKTLMQGTHARTEERVRAAYAIELIDQKIRESADGLRLEHVAFNCIHTLRPENSLSILGL